MTVIGDGQDPRIIYPPRARPEVQAVRAGGVGADAFGRLRVSAPHQLLPGRQILDSQPLLWDTLAAGGGVIGAHDPDRASTTLASSGAASTRAVRQTRRYYPYAPGQSQLVAITFRAPGGVDGGPPSLTIRSSVSGSPVDNTVLSADWDDPMDGTGRSGVELDWSKTQILILDLQWLGVGEVRIGFQVADQVVLAHTFLHANREDAVYMSTGTLPVRYAIEDSAGGSPDRQVGLFDDDNGIVLTLPDTGATTLETICASVLREGGDEALAYPLGIPETLSRSATTTLTSLAAVRLRTGYERAALRDFVADLGNGGSNPVRWEIALMRAATASGLGLTTYTAADLGGALLGAGEYSVQQVASTTTQRRILAQGVLPAGGTGPGAGTGETSDLLGVTSDISGASDVAVLSVQSVASTSQVYGTFQWREVY